MKRLLRAFPLSQSMTLDGILVVATIGLAIGTAGTVVAPAILVHVIAPSLDIVLDTFTTAVTLGVVGLGWIRYRQSGQPAAVFQAAAFLVLAIANALPIAFVTTGLDVQAGMALVGPGQAPMYLFPVARLFAAGLLVLGGLASLRSKVVHHAAAMLLFPSVAMLLLVGLIEAAAPALPSLGAFGLAAERSEPPPMAMPTPFGASIELLAAALFLWAAGLSRRLWRRNGSISDGYFALGFVFAAFAQINATVYPGTYTGLVTSGDIMRLVFDVFLLLGIQAEGADALRRLRRANQLLAWLMRSEAARAGLEERARLSRELHDGLSQDLWLAKLKAARLAARPDLGPEARALTTELGQAIDAGLAQAHEAVATLRVPDEPGGSFGEVLAKLVNDFADRFGVRVEFEHDPALPALPPRAQVELMRITQEALTNVRRHADATVVRVRATTENGGFLVAVKDNGRGFDPSNVGPDAYGLAGMKERAAQIGGDVTIDSRPLDGTLVRLRIPLEGSAGPRELVTAS